MEIVEIHSTHSLITSIPDSRPTGAHVYKVHCGQFSLVHKHWQKDSVAHERPLGIMTVGFERIWLTAEEAEKVVTAIRSSSSPIALG
jgi:hypothetical protein